MTKHGVAMGPLLPLLLVVAGLAPAIGQELLFAEEFDRLDTTRWQHIVSAAVSNNEFQYYTSRPENSYVRNGLLYVRPTLTAERFGEDFLFNGTLDLRPDGCTAGCTAVPGPDIISPIQSARLRTINSFSFTYGTVVVRAKMPRGDWLWPAVWLMPTDNAFGGWPRSGEIDMVELRGNNDLVCNGQQIGNRAMSSTLHFGPDNKHDVWRLTNYPAYLLQDDFASDFHIFALQRFPDVIKFYVDGHEIGSVRPPRGGFWQLGNFDEDPGGANIWANGTDMTPFDRRFHFILNVAVGGNYFPDGCANFAYPKPWRSSDDQQKMTFWNSVHQWYPTWNPYTEDHAMQVDYIRVYSHGSIETQRQQEPRPSFVGNALDPRFEPVY